MRDNTVRKTLRRWLRWPFVRPRYADQSDLAGKKILVTGASPGSLGFATAQTLLNWGAELIVTARSDSEKAVQALSSGCSGDGAKVSGHRLDLSSVDSVETFVDWYRREHGDKLDVLVNNAGIHLDLLSQWDKPQLTEDDHEIHWRTNFLGSFHLTQRLLPMLRASAKRSGDARVVNVVSQLHTKGRNRDMFETLEPYNSWVAYGLSKLAMVHTTFELQRRYAAEGLQAYCLHPGGVFTGIADKGLAGSSWLSRIRHALAPVEALFLLSPEEGAQTSIYCASSPEVRGGSYYRDCQVAEASSEASDLEAASKLWNETLAWMDTRGSKGLS